jgi:amino acid adenylation domain-containing protein/thioester reductase-like protein
LERELYPLSSSQRNIWNLSRAYLGTPMNNVCNVLRISGAFKPELVQKCLQALYAAFPALTTRVVVKNGVPMQYQSCIFPSEAPFEDFSGDTSSGEDVVSVRLAQWKRDIAREPIALENSPLAFFYIFKDSHGSGGVMIKLHHIITDAWSQILLNNHLMHNYKRLMNGEPLDDAVTPPYSAHVEAEGGYIKSLAFEKDSSYWSQRIKALSQIQGGDFSTMHPGKIAERREFLLPAGLSRRVLSFCRDRKISPFTALYMAFAAYQLRARGRSAFPIGVPSINRVNHRRKETLGMFVNTLPFFTVINENMTFNTLCENVKNEWFSLLSHQRLPYENIKNLAPSGSGNLFDAVISYQNGRLDDNTDPLVHFVGEWVHSGHQAESLCIHLSHHESDRLLIYYDYIPHAFTGDEIDALHRHMMNILSGGISQPDIALSLIPMLEEGEEEQLIFGFNRTEAPPLFKESLAQRLVRVANEISDNIAVEHGGKSYSYGRLMEDAAFIARGIFERYPLGGEVIAISMQNGYELMACLCAVVLSGNAWLLIDREQPGQRLASLITQCRASLLISDRPADENAGGIQQVHPSSLRRTGQGASALPPQSAPDDIAYIVSTSGSSGAPKAVQVMQKSLLNLADAMLSFYPEKAVLSLCNIAFDAFLLESVCALLCGRTIIIPQSDHMNDPSRLAEYISKFDAGFFALTPSRLQAYLQNSAFCKSLKGVKSIICGGEALPASLVRLLSRHSSAVLYNQYGPCEATVAVMMGKASSKDPVTIGKPMRNCRIYILDDNMQPLPVGSVGEIYIGGPCLARGYASQPELTAQSFIPDPFRPGERLYKSGDLGRWTSSGEIIFSGRKDRQVKLRGHRIELAEVESCLLSYEGITAAVANIYEGRLVAYFTCAGAAIDPDRLLSHAAEILPVYMVPVHAQQVEGIHFTPNGKIDYSKLPAPNFSDDGVPEDQVEQRLLSIWQSVLKADDIGTRTSFYRAGGDSLSALSLIASVEAEFGVQMDISSLQTHGTISRMAALLRKGNERRLEEIPLAPRDESAYSPSPAQKSFFTLAQLDESGLAYNMPGAFLLEEKLDIDRLEDAFKKLIDLDEILRTGFEIQGMDLICKVHNRVDFNIQRFEGSLDDAMKKFVRRFDLGSPPLLRAGLLMGENGRQVLLLDMHHIISDGISSPVTIDRLSRLYQGDTPKMPRLAYRDYALWINDKISRQGSATLEDQRNFWRSCFEGGIPDMDLPTDNPRSAVFESAGARHNFQLSKEVTGRLKDYCARAHTTPYVLLLAVYGLLLSRYSNAQRLIVGSPVSGRRLASLQEITGAFVNTLPMLLSPKEDLRFEDYLKNVHNFVALALDNQEVPFGEILNISGAPHSRERNPLYSVMFSFVPMDPEELEIGGSKMRPLAIGVGSVKMDMHLEATMSGDCLRLSFEYATALFDEQTVSLYSRGLKAALVGILAGENLPLRNIPIITEEDKARLYTQPWHNRAPYDDSPVDQIIDSFAKTAPDAAAIRWGENQSHSFLRVKEMSDNLAFYLQEKGVCPGDVVAFMPKRNGEMIPTIIGILKAGAAYLPVEPSFPADRIIYMLETAKAKLLLFPGEITPPRGLPCPSFMVDFSAPEGQGPAPSVNRSPEDPFNVLFTSGSTGQPKGVMMIHRSISNLLAHVEPLLAGPDSRMLCASSCVFDVFTTEALLCLAAGRCAVIADEEEMLLPWKLAARIEKDRADILQLTPSRMQMCLASEEFRHALRDVKSIILLGEPWTLSMRDEIKGLTNARIFNIYGPTETSVHNCQGDVTDEGCIHIGLPIGNCRYYLLDEKQRLLPPTAVGEIYIAGDCLARGYVNRDDLTEKVYLPDPFFPGERMYKTGDIGRMRADGTWQCLGRTDTQLKLNGHRIEPPEIAAQIVLSALAKEAAVIPVMHGGVPQSLRAYLVPTQDYSEEKLQGYLAGKLPDYMLPSSYVALDEMPRNASGKTDLKALARMNPELRQTPTRQSPSTPEDESLFGLWAQALGKEPDAEKSFFAQGGTSLIAIIILNHYHQQNIPISLSDFYAHPTLSAQAKLLRERQQAPAQRAQSGDKMQDVQKLFGKIPLNERQLGLSGAILLTGTTGYLGAHILSELLKSGAEKIVCLVRGDAENRLRESLSYYFGEDFLVSNRGRIEALSGDVSQKDLGLSPEDYADLSCRIKTVFHSAADVRHFAPWEELELANVKGTKTVIDFALAAGADLAHISTVSVAGEYLVDHPQVPAAFSEHDLDIGQNWRENPYCKSKALAECAVVQAMIKEGLNAKIFRVGRLVSRRSDGLFQPNAATNAFYREVSAMLSLGCAPASMESAPFELTEVDLCAKAIVRLCGQSGGAFHVFNPNMPTFGQLASAFDGLRFIPDKAFAALLKESLKGAESTSGYLLSLSQTYFSGAALAGNVTMDAFRTEALLKLAGFSWPKPSIKSISQCFLRAKDEVST